MRVDNDEDAKNWLKGVGYYRLSAYWLPFENPPEHGQTRSKRFRSGTNLQKIRDIYIFDRKLRVLLLEAIERIEIHVRSRWTYHMVHEHGSHAHLSHELFTGALKHAEQLVRLARAVEKSEETFIIHYRSKYTEPYTPPLWAATELMTLGELSKWVQATKNNSIKSAVSRDLHLPSRELLESVLQVFSYVRNICAHHGRLWNRRLVKRVPWIRRYRSDLVAVTTGGQTQPDNRIFNVIVILVQLLHQQSTDSTFSKRLRDLLDTVGDEERSAMGFPEDWRNRPAWNLSATQNKGA
ncbi:Abi family protein [Roseibium sp. MMSF_3544]|uniref:Abi family protein n=1 Tax=unclassified Roseibium TaxID=2629323 RepID=UPI00273D3B00|nr:Abi family protein [Roseibium sp. MMSF_3544]